MGLRKPFKTAALVLIWGWILLFVLVPNLLVIVTSFLIRRYDSFCLHGGWKRRYVASTLTVRTT